MIRSTDRRDSQPSHPGDRADPRQGLLARESAQSDESEVSQHCSTVLIAYAKTIRRYDERIAQLERELEQRGGPSQSSHHHGPSQPQPPQIGHGPSNLFGGIMAGSANQGGPGLAPPPQDPNPPHGMPPQLGSGPQGPSGLNPAPGPPQHFGGYQPGPSANGELHALSLFLGGMRRVQ